MINSELENFLKTEPDFKFFKKKRVKDDIFLISHSLPDDKNCGIDFVYYNERDRDLDFDDMFF